MGLRDIYESMYESSCDVIEYKKVKNPVTKVTEFKEVTVISEQPCRLSYKSSPVSGDGNAASITQEIKLFLSPDVIINDGSKIVVTQRGHTKTFTNSSEPMIYDNHQEIALKLFERWS